MKAKSIGAPEVMVQEASDVMLLMISSNVWDILVTQAQGDGTAPGVVLEQAVRAYIGDHGVDDAKSLLERLDRLPVARLVD